MSRRLPCCIVWRSAYDGSARLAPRIDCQGLPVQRFSALPTSGRCSPGRNGRCVSLLPLQSLRRVALDLAVLFDRFSPQGRLFPRESALLELLDLINHPEIAVTLDRRRNDRLDISSTSIRRKSVGRCVPTSPAPRNSRELGVRNQFFTPRYVVEFLTDNTLGRLWYEMTQGKTALADQCPLPGIPSQRDFFTTWKRSACSRTRHQRNCVRTHSCSQPVCTPFRALTAGISR